MVHGGACLARSDEGTVLVDGAVPGELVEAELRHRRRGTWFAGAVDVVEASPFRTRPPCPYVPECGGCQLQHVDPRHQIELKRAIVADAMRRAGVALPGPIPVHGMAHPWHYRCRAELHVIPGRRGMADAELGFTRARSWTPIAIDDCLIHETAIVDSLPRLRRLAREAAVRPLDALHVTAGEDGAELLVRARPEGAVDAAALERVALSEGGDIPWVTDSTTRRWRGRAYRITPRTFVQANWTQMDVLYQRVLDALGPLHGRRLVDAYAGIGVLSVDLAAEAAEVVCVEASGEAARMARLNARINGVGERLRCVARAAEDALPELAASLGGWREGDGVVVDPPRAGCDPRLTAWLALAGPPTLVYVSCDPATLARDLRVLAASGPYGVASLDVVDMFPHTHHVECVAALTRGGP